MEIIARAYHNITTDERGRHAGFDGYMPGHEVTHVATLTFIITNQDEVADPLMVCDWVYRLLNIGDDPTFTSPPDPQAVAYRQRRNRSLSVGDLVEVDGTFYFCEPGGWIELVDSKPRIVERSVPGSTHLPACEARAFELGLSRSQEV